MATERAVHLEIRGRVQGVFFRASARERAAELGLRGWIRNLPDGSVEAVAGGDDAAVEDFIVWCRTGSTAARVDRVVVEPAAEAVQGTEFEIRR